MNQDYTPISFERMDQYLDILSRNKTQASDYSFANIWGWAPYYGLEWRFDGMLCWIRQQRPYPCCWAPVGPWDTVHNWLDYPEMAPGSRLIRVPHSLCEQWSIDLEERIVVEEARGQWDYLYLAEELASLSGNRFHKKKNLLKQFQKLYNYEYKSLSANCVETVLNMQTEWCRWRDCESSEALLAENDAVARVLAHWNNIPGLCGGIIRIDGVPVAYTLAEPLNDNTLIIHFEKAAGGIKGAYQAINYMFCNDVGKNYTYINREQDLDDEGLRKAKLSYNPVDFSKKCSVSVR
ncbi:phosphatidylglycerol lysyltransferase domain-containing protein [Desulfovibrio sp. OttesenSCG-928-A18]|nr:phosphatidylglycerol lysyltransferase domain-containing protein [Desulfovibrio sp. OttesenSCG-928-A18]